MTDSTPPVGKIVGREVRRLDGHCTRVLSVALSPDDAIAASGSRGPEQGKSETARLWDVAAGTPLAMLRATNSAVHAVAFSPDGRLLASGESDKLLRLWDVARREQVGFLDARTGGAADASFTGAFTAVVFSPDGLWVASNDADHSVRLWDPNTGDEVGRFDGHTDYVTGIDVSPDGRRLATTSWDKTLRVWDVAGGSPPPLFPKQGLPPLSVAFAAGGKRLVTGNFDGSVQVWDAATGERLFVLRGHKGSVHCVAALHDGVRAASGGEDATIRLWDIASGRPLAWWPAGGANSAVNFSPGWKGPIHGLACSRDDRFLLSGGSDCSLRVWEIPAP